jgi:hypothetical protein
MPVPSARTGLSPAVADLGLGDLLGQQVSDETEEARKKRMALMQERRMIGPAGSPATLSLFGGLPSGYGT